MNRKSTSIVVTAAALTGLLLVRPARAQFLSDAVYWIQQLAAMEKQYTQLQQSYNALNNQVQMAKQNLDRYTTKNFWQTQLVTMGSEAQAANVRGETSGWSGTLNGNPGGATAAWERMTTQLNNPAGWMQHEVVGQSHQLSTLANVEAMDASAPNCMSIIGNYRQQRQQNLQAIQALQASQFDTSDASAGAMHQAEMQNAAAAQQLNQGIAQGDLQSCLAEQQLISNGVYRNAQASSLNTFSGFAAAQSSTPVFVASPASTLQNYDTK